MSFVSGYARRPEPKWPYLVLVSIIIVVLVLLVIIVNLLRSCFESAGELAASLSQPTVTIKTVIPVMVKSSTVIAEKVVLTSRIEGNRPVDQLEKIAAGSLNKLYCYTKIELKAVPQTIHHQWLAPGGKIWADIELNISRQPADTWSYINLTGAPAGQWSVQVKNAAGEVIARQSFTLY